MRARLPKKVLAFALCLALGVSSTLVAIADEEAPAGMVIAEPIADVSDSDENVIPSDADDITKQAVELANEILQPETATVSGNEAVSGNTVTDGNVLPMGETLAAYLAGIEDEEELALALISMTQEQINSLEGILSEEDWVRYESVMDSYFGMDQEQAAIDYNTMSAEELFQYLESLTDDVLYYGVLNSLSDEKLDELFDYIQMTSAAVEEESGIVSNLDPAPLIVSGTLAPMRRMSLLAAVAENTNFNKVVDKVSDGLTISKNLKDYKDGKGTLVLDAYVTGQISTVESAIPVDIVLVLDQSGSMAEDSFGSSGYVVSNLKNAAAYTYQNRYQLYVYIENEYKGVSIVQGDSTDQNVYIGDEVTFSNIYNASQKYYYDIDGISYEVVASRTSTRGTYYLKVGDTIIASGSRSQFVNDNMEWGYEEGIYTIEKQYSYIYKVDNVEIGRSEGANGQPPKTLFTYQSSQISNLAALKAAAANFIDSVAQNAVETGADHRVAIVGFASGSGRGGDGSNSSFLNTELFIGANQYNYNNSTINGQYGNAYQYGSRP